MNWEYVLTISVIGLLVCIIWAGIVFGIITILEKHEFVIKRFFRRYKNYRHNKEEVILFKDDGNYMFSDLLTNDSGLWYCKSKGGAFIYYIVPGGDIRIEESYSSRWIRWERV